MLFWTMQHFVILLKENNTSFSNLSAGCKNMKNCDTSRKEIAFDRNHL